MIFFSRYFFLFTVIILSTILHPCKLFTVITFSPLSVFDHFNVINHSSPSSPLFYYFRAGLHRYHPFHHSSPFQALHRYDLFTISKLFALITFTTSSPWSLFTLFAVITFGLVFLNTLGSHWSWTCVVWNDTWRRRRCGELRMSFVQRKSVGRGLLKSRGGNAWVSTCSHHKSIKVGL